VTIHHDSDVDVRKTTTPEENTDISIFDVGYDNQTILQSQTHK